MATTRSRGNVSKSRDGDQITSGYFQDGRHAPTSRSPKSTMPVGASLSPDSLKDLIKECPQDLETKVNVISNTTDTILTEQKQLLERLSKVESRCEDFEKAVQFSSEEVEAVRGQCQHVESQIDDIKGDLAKIQSEYCDLKEECLNLERYSRSNNLRFGGIPEAANGKCVDLIKTLLTEKFKMADVIIENAHRVPSRASPERGPRHIIVRFARKTERNRILALRKTALTGSGVFVTEDLCRADYNAKKNLKTVMDAAYGEGKKVKFVKGKLFIDNKLYQRPP